MLPNRPLRESALPRSEIHVKPFGATRSTFQKAHLCLSSSYAFECDSRDQCLKSKSFFLSQMKAQVKNKIVCQYQSTDSSLYWLSFVFISNYKNVNLRICTSTSLRVSYWNEFGRTKEFWKSFYETLDCASSWSSSQKAVSRRHQSPSKSPLSDFLVWLLLARKFVCLLRSQPAT